MRAAGTGARYPDRTDHKPDQLTSRLQRGAIVTGTPKKQKNLEHVAWSTQLEINWLNKIGSHSGGLNNVSQFDLLTRYQIGIARRVNWENIDPEAVSAHLSALLKAAVLEPGAKIG